MEEENAWEKWLTQVCLEKQPLSGGDGQHFSLKYADHSAGKQ